MPYDPNAPEALFMRRFAPETWPPARRFLEFAGPPFKVDHELELGFRSIVAHGDKYDVLADLAQEVLRVIDEDAAELESTGYTSALRGRQLAVLFEAMVSEGYSVLDGFRKAVFSIYRGVKGIQSKSTKILFERAAAGEYGPVADAHPAAALFPELCKRLAAAYEDWFPKFREIRTLTVHGLPGLCRKESATGLIIYFRPGGLDHRLADALGWLNSASIGITGLTGWFSAECFQLLKPIERPQMCGIYRARIYERFVAPNSQLSVNDGRCLSWEWFDSSSGLECPLKTSCEAYRRPVPADERAAHYSQR